MRLTSYCFTLIKIDRLLTHANKDWNVSTRSKVGGEDDGDDVSDLVHGGDDAGNGGRNFVAFFNRCYHRVLK